MLSSILNTPYPPPDLLHPMAEKIQIISTPPQQSERSEASMPSADQQVSAAPAVTAEPVAAEKTATA